MRRKPPRIKVFHLAFGLGHRKSVAPSLIQGQALCDACEQFQGKRLQLQFASVGQMLSVIAPSDAAVAQGPFFAVFQSQGQAFAAKVLTHTLAPRLMLNTAMHAAQDHGIGLLARLPTQALHIQIQGLRDQLALVHLSPQPQPALTGLQLLATHKVQIRVNGRHIDSRQGGIDLAIPAFQIAGVATEQGLIETPLQAQALAPLGRR